MNDSHNSPNGHSYITSTSKQKRKYYKNFNGMVLDKITENQKTPNTFNNFLSVYTSEFLEKAGNHPILKHSGSS